jgi:hypothetical protein
MRLHRQRRLIGAGNQADRIPAAIVQHRQRMAAAARQPEMALEIHLPQLVRAAPLEPLERAVLGGLRRIQQAMPAQHLGHCRGRRHLRQPQITQPTRQLAPAPARMGLPQRDDLGLDRGRTAPRAGVRPAGPIGQSRRALLAMPA